ncbi:MAG: GYF domain-containing protein [Chthoniobacterales bacterium]
MNPLEDNRRDEWFVRVQEKEYGPVDLRTLQDWKAEGRLIPENQVRKSGEATWTAAAALAGLFPQPPPLPKEPGALLRRRSFSEIIAETCRIYGKGFPQFFALALLVALPSLGLKLSLAFINLRDAQLLSGRERIASVVAIVMLAAVLVGWPIFLGGLQFAAAELAARRRIRLGDVLRRAVAYWPRVARLCVFVYGTFLFWTVLPLLAVLALAGAPIAISVPLGLLALAIQVYMAGRLFINFMFWQQSSTLAQLEAVEALRESRELARSRADSPWMLRPLYRGALLASIWVVILLVFSAAVELPFLLVRMQGITTLEQTLTMMQTLVDAPAPDKMMIASYALSSLVHAALRPLLGIAFVVLYFDAKAVH